MEKKKPGDNFFVIIDLFVLGIFSWRVQMTFPKNYKILLKEIEKATNKWKGVPCSRIRRINVMKCPY